MIRRIHAGSATHEAIVAGDLELDLNRRSLRKAGKLVHLTPTEFDLLALLMRNEGTPLPHTRLLRMVWGPDHGDELDYLQSHVKALRKKIEDDPCEPKYLVTQAWLGYRFCNPSIDS